MPSGMDLSQPPPGYKTQAYDISHQQEEVTVSSEVEFVEPNDNGDVEVSNKNIYQKLELIIASVILTIT